MIQNNVVLVETIEGAGTGILYPCKVRREFFIDGNNWSTDWKYYIIFTSGHVFKSMGVREEKSCNEEICQKDYSSQIRIHMYDSLQREIPQSMIHKVLLYNSGDYFDEANDIAAMLVAIDNSLPMIMEEKISTNILENRTSIYIEGYPGVLSNDSISGRLQLAGMEKRIFPPNQDIGVYQITDDYHWYNNFHDRQLLQGLSGSPVYYSQEGTDYLLGMVQSVSDIGVGENPFKLMYYIRFQRILTHLREAECIIYRKTSEHCFEIEWIYGSSKVENKITNEKGKEVSLLLLGSSGAGKSSFAEALCYHGDILQATSDGQTTRTKIIYHLSINESNPCMNVKFLQQKDFCHRMLQNMDKKTILYVIQQIFDLPDESVRNEQEFLENAIKLTRLILENVQKEQYDLLDSIMGVKDASLVGAEACKCYETIINLWLKQIPIDMVKYLLDINALESEIDKSGKISDELTWVFYQHNINELIYMQYYRESKGTGFVPYQERVWSKLRNQTPEEINLKKLKKKICKDTFLSDIQDKLLYSEAFFDIEEFVGFVNENTYKENILSYISKRDADDEDDNEESESGTSDTFFSGDNAKIKREMFHIRTDNEQPVSKIVLLYNGFKEYYRAVHRMLKEKLKEHRLLGNTLSWECKLKDCSLEEKSLMQQCLRVTDDGKSLTGFVDYVEIKDCITDPYTFILREQMIQRLILIDTCGLDHVNVYSRNELKNLLENTKYFCKNHNMTIANSISVLYIKKLDSGKPDELRTIIPVVRETFPSNPLYCVFTGIDIFYRFPEEIKSLNWNNIDENTPKAIKYIHSNKFKEENEFDQNMYLVLKNNLVPFCGKKKKVMDCFEIYQNNYFYVRGLFASVAMKEYSSLEIVDEDCLNKLQEARENVDSYVQTELEKDVRGIIHSIFSKASLNARDFRYNTKLADLRSFSKLNKMGYWGVYKHRLGQLFSAGYSLAILEYSRKIGGNNVLKQPPVIAAMKNMEEKFLGSWCELENVSVENIGAFRENIEKILLEKVPDLFSKKFSNDINHENRDKLFNAVFQFEDGLDTIDQGEVLQELIKHFFDCLVEQIVEDNRAKAKNIFLLDADFKEEFLHLENSFLKRYQGISEDNKEGKKKLYQILKYYFSEK